jgi:hypothetical protein
MSLWVSQQSLDHERSISVFYCYMDTSTSYLHENESKNTTVEAQPEYIIPGQVEEETKHRAVQITVQSVAVVIV